MHESLTFTSLLFMLFVDNKFFLITVVFRELFIELKRGMTLVNGEEITLPALYQGDENIF